MNDLEKKSIECIKNMPIEETTYQVARNVVLDYINNLQQENERLKQPKIFIDTQDMEERYGEELYKDYLEKQVNDYKSRIKKVVDFINKNCVNHKVSKEVGFKVYTMMVTDELEKVMKILENGKE